MSESAVAEPEKEKPVVVYGNEKEAIGQANSLTKALPAKRNGEPGSPFKVYKVSSLRRIEKFDRFVVARSPAVAATIAANDIGLTIDRSDVPTLVDPEVYVGLIDDEALAILKDAIAQREADSENTEAAE